MIFHYARARTCKVYLRGPYSNNSIQNQKANAQFTPGSLGIFHSHSGGFPPFPSGNFNTNPTPGSSVGFPFGWNWNSSTSHGQQMLV